MVFAVFLEVDADRQKFHSRPFGLSENLIFAGPGSQKSF
jgi:hypothetical protein